MNIKTYMAAAVAALTLAACSNQEATSPAADNATADVQLNADGSVADAATEAAPTEQAK